MVVISLLVLSIKIKIIIQFGHFSPVIADHYFGEQLGIISTIAFINDELQVKPIVEKLLWVQFARVDRILNTFSKIDKIARIFHP